MDRQRKIDRGLAVKELLENEHCQEALAEIKEQFLAGLVGSAPNQAELREEIYYFIKVTEQLTDVLQGYVNDGTIELNNRKREESEQ